MKKPADAFTPPLPPDDPFHTADRVLTVRCSVCYHVMGVLEVLREPGEPLPTADDLDEVLNAVYWAKSGYPSLCPHADRRPPVAELRSRVAEALRRGVAPGPNAPAPVTVRI